MLKTKDLYDISHTRAASLLESTEYPWEALPKIKELILEIGPQLPKDEFDEISENVLLMTGIECKKIDIDIQGFETNK